MSLREVLDLPKLPLFSEEAIHNFLFLEFLDNIQSKNKIRKVMDNIHCEIKNSLIKKKFNNEFLLFDIYPKLNCFIEDLNSNYSYSLRRSLLYNKYLNKEEISNDDELNMIDEELKAMMEYDLISFTKSYYLFKDMLYEKSETTNEISQTLDNKQNINTLQDNRRIFEVDYEMNKENNLKHSLLKSNQTAALKISEIRTYEIPSKSDELEIIIGLEDNTDSGYFKHYSKLELLLIDNNYQNQVKLAKRVALPIERVFRKIILHTDEKVEKTNDLNYFSFNISNKENIKHIILDPFNKRYCINVYPIKTLNFIIYNFSSDFTCDSYLYNNLAIKFINEIFILIKLKILESAILTQFVYKCLLNWYSNKEISSLIVYYYLSLINYSINNFMYSSEVNTSKKIFFRLISEHYIWDENMIDIKENLIDFLINFVNVNDQDQISFLFNMIFINKEEDDSQIFMRSKYSSENLTLSVINSKSDQDSIMKDKQSINSSIRKQTLFKLIKKVYECTVLTRYEKSLILKYSENLSLLQNFELLMSIPNLEYKTTILDNILQNKYMSIMQEFSVNICKNDEKLTIFDKVKKLFQCSEVTMKKRNFNQNSSYTSLDLSEIFDNYLHFQILKNYVKKQHYNQSMNFYYRKRFLESMDYLISRENTKRCYFNYYFMNTKDVLTIKNTANYISLKENLSNVIGNHLDFTVDFLEDYFEIANNIDICEFKEGIYLI